MMGMPDLKEELESIGLQVTGMGKMFGVDEQFDDPYNHVNHDVLDNYELDPEVGAVVVGGDYTMTYSKVAIASLYLQHGRKFIVTNEDAFGRTKNGNRSAATGSMVAAIEASLINGDGSLLCEKVVTGKPNPTIVDIIREDHNIPSTELPKFVMIGDNPMTDIALGNNAGISTCLTLDGVVKNLQEAAEWSTREPSQYKPTHIIQSFGDKML